MSMISSTTGTTFEAGFFLVDDERCTRQSMTIAANHAQRVTRNGRTIVPMGAVIPANGATAKGIPAATALTQIRVIATSPTVTRPAAFDVEG